MALKRGIEKAVAVMKAELESMAQPVEGKEQIKQVAVLAAHDEEMGGILADVIDEVGSEGVVTIEESKGVGYEVEYVEGMQVDRGFQLSLFRHRRHQDDRRNWKNPYVLVTTEKISSMADLLPLLEKLTAISRTLVIVSEDVEGEALATPGREQAARHAQLPGGGRPPASATGARPYLKTWRCSSARTSSALT